MPLFGYTAMGTDGREVQGDLEATDARDAASILRSRSLYVLNLAPAGATAVPDPQRDDAPRPEHRHTLLARLRPIRSHDRVAFFRQLALMQRSGLTLIEGLRVVHRQADKPTMADAIARVIMAIQNGRTFSDALSAEPRVFPAFAIKLIQSAEASGELDVVLDRIAAFMERQAQLRTHLLTSLTYPAIVVVVSLAVAVFLVVKVIPRFSAYLSQRQVALPWSAQFLMSISEWIQTYGPALGVIILVLLIGLLAAARWRPGQLVLHRFALRIPVVGGVLMSSAMATFGRTLGMLLRSGVSLLDSLRITRQVMGNQMIAHRIHTAGEQVLAGRDLAGALDDPVFPPAVTRVVAVGEQTGSLSEVLEELGQFYDDQLQTAIRRMSAMIEPAMILILGVMVGFVYFAFFQAVFRLATAG
jgi:type IV pilus assembly protein PilC